MAALSAALSAVGPSAMSSAPELIARGSLRTTPAAMPANKKGREALPASRPDSASSGRNCVGGRRSSQSTGSCCHDPGTSWVTVVVVLIDVLMMASRMAWE